MTKLLLTGLLLAGSLALPAPSTLAAPQAADRTQAELDAWFAELLTGARLVGFTTLDDAEGLKEDSYTLTRASKQADGRWLFEATVEFGGTSIPISLPLPVEWAGDTPVITVDNMGFPMLGKYSARVLFHGDQYVGVWSGEDHGGQMFGRVVRGAAAPAGSAEPGAGDGAEDDKGALNWPSFRGPGARGVAEGYPTALEWDVESGENVLWRAEVPGLAHSSPVIWGDKLFVTTAIRADGEQELKVGLYGDIMPIQDDSEFSFELHCLDKKTGEPLWSKSAWTGVPAIKRHPKGSYAASSPACDGERVLAFFGSAGLYCFSVDGELQWKKDFGVLDSGFFMVPSAQWGFASSPVLHDGRAIVQCDVQKGSFLAAFDAATGEELWRTARDEVPTWSTPTVDVRAGRSQVICNGFKHIGGYDLETGEELWKLVGGGDIPVPTPVVAGDLIFVTSAHGSMAPIYAIEASASGTLTIDPDVTEAMAWSRGKRGNYMQTPLAYGEEVYFCNDAGILTCYDITSGEEIYRERLGEGRSGFTGSGIAADGKLYFTSEEGEVYVVSAGRTFEVLATSPLGEEFMSSPAASEGVLYFRARSHVVAVGG